MTCINTVIANQSYEFLHKWACRGCVSKVLIPWYPAYFVILWVPPWHTVLSSYSRGEGDQSNKFIVITFLSPQGRTATTMKISSDQRIINKIESWHKNGVRKQWDGPHNTLFLTFWAGKICECFSFIHRRNYWNVRDRRWLVYTVYIYKFINGFTISIWSILILNKPVVCFVNMFEFHCLLHWNYPLYIKCCFS